MGWGSGRKRFKLVFALRPRSGAHHRTRACLRSGSLVTNSSFLRCAARLARGGLNFRFPKYRQEKHRCDGRTAMQRMRLHPASNSLRTRSDAVLCHPRTLGVSAQMQTETDKQCRHMKCTIRPFQGVAEYFVFCMGGRLASVRQCMGDRMALLRPAVHRGSIASVAGGLDTVRACAWAAVLHDGAFWWGFECYRYTSAESPARTHGVR